MSVTTREVKDTPIHRPSLRPGRYLGWRTNKILKVVVEFYSVIIFLSIRVTDIRSLILVASGNIRLRRRYIHDQTYVVRRIVTSGPPTTYGPIGSVVNVVSVVSRSPSLGRYTEEDPTSLLLVSVGSTF